MLRSHTDSHIDYSVVDEPEAPGSGQYITRNGALDLQMVMLAVFQVFNRDAAMCSLRVLETGLNVCELLIELGVMCDVRGADEQQQLGDQGGAGGGGVGPAHTEASGAVRLCEKSLTLALGVARRTLLHLGCPHGCNDGERLRMLFLNQCSNCRATNTKGVNMNTTIRDIAFHRDNLYSISPNHIFFPNLCMKLVICGGFCGLKAIATKNKWRKFKQAIREKL